MKTCVFPRLVRGSGAVSMVSEGADANLHPEEPSFFTPVADAGFEFSKITKLLTRSTVLCSAVLFIAVTGATSALADQSITGPVETNPNGPFSENVTITVTETDGQYGIYPSDGNITFESTDQTNYSLSIDVSGNNTYPAGIEVGNTGTSVTISGWKEVNINTKDTYKYAEVKGIDAQIGNVTIDEVGSVEITVGEAGYSYGICADGYDSGYDAPEIRIAATDTVTITAIADYSAAGTYVGGGSSIGITAQTVTININSGDTGVGIYVDYDSSASIQAANLVINTETEFRVIGIDVYSSTMEVVGTDPNNGTLKINASAPADPWSYASYGAEVNSGRLSVSNFASADIIVGGTGSFGLHSISDDGDSSIELKDIGAITINAEMGVLSFRSGGGEESSISLTSSDKISISSYDTTDAENKLAGMAVSSVFSTGGYYGAVGEDSRTAVVSLSSSELEINANQAFAAVLTYQWVEANFESVSENVKQLSAATGTSINSIINVSADKLTVNATDFVAVAYVDTVLFTNFLDWSEYPPAYNPIYDSGQTAQINLNVIVDGDGTPTINGTSTLSGNVFADHNSQINIGLGGGSTWTGFSQDDRAETATHVYYGEQFTDPVSGEVNVYAAGGAVWNVRPVIETTIKEDISGDGYRSVLRSESGGGINCLIVSGTKSYLTTWYSQDSSVINLNLSGTGITYNGGFEFQPVDIKYLLGSGTQFQVHTNIDGERGEGLSTDQAIIHSGSGEHYIYVEPTGVGSADYQLDYLIWHMEEEGASSAKITLERDDDGNIVSSSQDPSEGLSFTLANTSKIEANAPDGVTVVEGGLYYYTLATRDAEDGDGTEWYLVRAYQAPETKHDPDDPDPDPDPGIIEPGEEIPPDTGGDTGPGPATGGDPETPEGKTVAALSGIGARLSMHYAWLDDLRKRLGEVRYGAQDGLWARFIYQRDSGHGTSVSGFRQNWYGLSLGLDHIVSQDEDRMWLLGGNFKSGHGSQKVNDARGKGNLNSYGMNLYATYANQYGCYADMVLSLDKYHQKIGATMDSGDKPNGKYNTWGWGASAEIGKMFATTQNNENWGPWHNHWWIEPQAQLSYYWTDGKDYSMSNGMTVNQKNGQSLVGRLGVVVGKQWSYGGADKVNKRYVQAYLKGGVKHEFLGKQDVKVNDVKFDKRLRGTSGYYGAGVDWNLTKQVKAYAQVERDAGGKYRKDIEASIGIKWQF